MHHFILELFIHRLTVRHLCLSLFLLLVLLFFFLLSVAMLDHGLSTQVVCFRQSAMAFEGAIIISEKRAAKKARLVYESEQPTTQWGGPRWEVQAHNGAIIITPIVRRMLDNLQGDIRLVLSGRASEASFEKCHHRVYYVSIRLGDGGGLREMVRQELDRAIASICSGLQRDMSKLCIEDFALLPWLRAETFLGAAPLSLLLGNLPLSDMAFLSVSRSIGRYVTGVCRACRRSPLRGSARHCMIARFSQHIAAFKQRAAEVRDICIYIEANNWRTAGVSGVKALADSELEIGAGDFAKKHLGIRLCLIPAAY